MAGVKTPTERGDGEDILDRTFMGLAYPRQTHELGAEVSGTRPGAILVGAVRTKIEEGKPFKDEPDRAAEENAARKAAELEGMTSIRARDVPNLPSIRSSTKVRFEGDPDDDLTASKE